MKNVDLSHIVAGHTDYADKIDDILISLGYAEEVGIAGELRKSVSTTNLKEKEIPLERALSVDSFLHLHKHRIHHHIDIDDLKAQAPPSSSAPTPTPYSSSSTNISSI